MKRELSYELVRASTIKSSFGFPLAGALLTWAVTIIFLWDPAEGTELQFEGLVGSVYSPLTALLVTVPFAQAFGQEYRDGTMRLTLSEFPDRTKVFFAKLLIPALFAVVAAVITVAGVGLIALFGPVSGFGDMPAIMFRAAGYTVMWGLLVAAVTVFTRNMAAGIAGVLVWGLILEQIFGSLLPDGVGRFMPVLRGTEWFQTGVTEGALVFLVASLLLTAGAYFKFTRTDA
jgi:ABC-2 type transport system permease protein